MIAVLEALAIMIIMVTSKESNLCFRQRCVTSQEESYASSVVLIPVAIAGRSRWQLESPSATFRGTHCRPLHVPYVPMYRPLFHRLLSWDVPMIAREHLTATAASFSLEI